MGTGRTAKLAYVTRDRKCQDRGQESETARYGTGARACRAARGAGTGALPALPGEPDSSAPNQRGDTEQTPLEPPTGALFDKLEFQCQE